MKQEEGKEDWVTRSKQENRPLFSELDILLRALDRYFNVENLTFSENIAGKNFYEELVTVRDTIMRRARRTGSRHTGKQEKRLLVPKIYRDKISPGAQDRRLQGRPLQAGLAGKRLISPL